MRGVPLLVEKMLASQGLRLMESTGCVVSWLVS